MTEACPEPLIDLAARAADAAGAIVRRYFRRPIRVEDKPDDSPVTVADREAEAAIRRLLDAEAPEHGIFGEEHGTHGIDRDYVWVLDPIDGTRAFICGQPTFCTLIALTHHGRPILGVVDQPITGERWIGARGHGTTLNGAAVETRDRRDLADAVLHTTDPALIPPPHRTAYDRLEEAVAMHRYGIDCYAYAMVASGYVDLVCEAGLQPYDYLAPAAVVENAGGVVTDWAGQPVGLAGNGRILAAGNATLHALARDLLNNGGRHSG